MKIKWPFILRAFFPSWVFFVEVSPEILLEARLINSESQENWIKVLPQIKRSIFNILWSAKNNYLHACHNSLQHLLADITELPAESLANVEDLPSYKIIKNLVSFELRSKKLKISSFQFKITVNYSEFQNKQSEQAVLSPEYQAEPWN